jgi:hypothetical protein
MKKVIFLCLILLNISFSFSQSIVTSNKLWYNFINYYTTGGIPVTGVEHIKFTIDTLINISSSQSLYVLSYDNFSFVSY